jgi:hypothetical protein
MIRNTNATTTEADVTVAMILGRPVTIDYEKADGSRTVRVVEPFVVQGADTGVKHPYFRAMDRRTREYRTFRFDRLYAYRVANASGRFRVPRPDASPVVVPSVTEWDDPAGSFSAPDGLGEPTADALDEEWGAWLESQYDPDAPVPYLPTPYALNEEK